ncbi:MAG: hypothetical protein ACK47B_02655 [Armatimonadota bacterium]
MRHLSRRSLLVSGLALSGVGLLSRSAEAAAGPATFYETVVTVPDLGDFNVWIALDGKKAYGLVTSAVGDEPPVRMEGKVRGTLVSLVLLLAHEKREQRIGTAELRSKNGGATLSGKVRSPALGRSALDLSVSRVAVDNAGVRNLSGRYTFEDGQAGARVSLEANRSFQLTGSYAGIPIGKVTGAWSYSPDGELWLLPRKASEINPFASLNIHVRAPVKLVAEKDGRDLLIFNPAGDELLVVLQG